MQSLIELSDNDKDQLFQSLLIITTNLDLFVIKFYSYFLKTDAAYFFKETDLEKHIACFIGLWQL